MKVQREKLPHCLYQALPFNYTSSGQQALSLSLQRSGQHHGQLPGPACDGLRLKSDAYQLLLSPGIKSTTRGRGPGHSQSLSPRGHALRATADGKGRPKDENMGMLGLD
ncbi:hypothetical protein EYF80_009201 [Liparis tanakae]|uniref:Uncharacterized protein n=1 Tax=Liparis tanakae TaxID=230148 RepID=A0A4Z2IT30_9TELE|nr:hypothetical protein EYF80_009201 [Liparis tanakae]